MKATLSAVGLASAFFLTALIPGTALAQNFTVEQVMSSPFPDDLTAAAHGERIAWVFDAKGVRNVWVADGPDFHARQVTHYSEDDGQAIASLRLTPDGRSIVYARGSELNHDDQVANPTSNVQRPEQQVWTAEVENGMPHLLGTLNCQEEGCEDIEISPDGQTAVWAARGQLWIAPVSGAVPAQQLCYVRGENDQPRWSPDGKKLAFVSHRGDHSFIVVYDRGRQTLLYLAPSVDRDQAPRWSPDSRQVVFTREPGAEAKMPIIPERPNPWSIWIADAENGAGHALWHSGPADNDSYPQLTEQASFNFSADGHIIFSSEQDGWNHLYSMPVAGGQPTLLTPGEFEVENAAMSIDGRSVVFSSNQDDIDRRHIWRVSAAGGKPEALSKGETMEWAPTETGDGRFVACLGSTATSPAMPYVLRSGGRDMLAREALPADFPSAQLVTPKQVTFPSEDGFTIHGQLFVPKGRAAAGPALVFMHGGSRRQMMLGFHYMQYYHNSYSENQYLASQGFVVLSINYRTGIMYGRAFREPANGGWRGASEYKDVVAAGKYLQTLPIVDAHKIGLWGGSYGGFLTAMGLSRNSDIFAAGVDMHGVHDWSARGFVGGGGAAGAPDMAAAAKLAWESSPDSTISTWKSPVLLIQGDDDRNVAFSQMVDLVQRLRAQHVPFEQIVFPDEIHDFLLWRSWVHAYKAEADFFQRVLLHGETIGTNN
ncbi:MAG TPA: prolyl oligopeptidase family serine peptidase [Candidatus Acidoferrales bacterium]|nr:prolyl oligopeptidase family serine peptidase [Candidatus Acidoferrales bacterium]